MWRSHPVSNGTDESDLELNFQTGMSEKFTILQNFSRKRLKEFNLDFHCKWVWSKQLFSAGEILDCGIQTCATYTVARD